MSDTLKNRLVGTIILVALVVIFLPQWLDGEKQSAEQSFLEVPGKPEALDIQSIDAIDVNRLQESTSMSEPAQDEATRNQQLEKLQEQQRESSASDVTEDRSSTDNEDASQVINTNAPVQTSTEQVESAAVQGGWVVQLGVFSEQVNIKRVTKQASDAGYRVFSEPAGRNGNLTKVFVGPEIEKATLENALPHLKEVTGLDGKLTEFQVSEN